MQSTLKEKGVVYALITLNVEPGTRNRSIHIGYNIDEKNCIIFHEVFPVSFYHILL